MFSSVMEEYNVLLNDFDTLSLPAVVHRLCELRQACDELFVKLSALTKQRIIRTTNVRINEYVISAGEDEDLFENICNIRALTQKELDVEAEDVHKRWKDILNQKEAYLISKIKDFLLKKDFLIGSRFDNDVVEGIQWRVFDVDPIHNKVKLLSSECVGLAVFEKRGYTETEDRDCFGCAETLCKWSDSDIRYYLNNEFYERSFSKEEKKLIKTTHRHVNTADTLITNDCSDDYVFLLTCEEFEHLESNQKKCNTTEESNCWWLSEQDKHGWDDDDGPEICVVNCKSGEKTSLWADDKALIRPAIMLDLSDLLMELANEH